MRTTILLTILVSGVIGYLIGANSPANHTRPEPGFIYVNEVTATGHELIAYPLDKFHIAENYKYELSVNQDYYTLFENDSVVATFNFGENPVLDNIILADNL